MDGKPLTSLTYTLTNEACDEIAEQITVFCESQKIDHKDMLRYRISAEECLIFWLKHGCEGKKVELRMGRLLLMPFILLKAEGQPLDPYRGDTEEFGSYASNMLANLRLAPEYSYSGGYNRLYFLLRKKHNSQLINLALVVALAVLVGVVGELIFPEALREILLDGIIIPVYDTFFNVLSCVAGPMIFLAVTWGIYGIGDATTLGRIGKRLILRDLYMAILVAVCGSVCFPLLGNQLHEAVGQENRLSDIAKLILGIFPSTIIEPFATGNTLQIIFLAIVIGVALLYLGQKTSAVARAVEQVNYLVQYLMELISRLVPFVIFLVVIHLIWNDDLVKLTGVWRLLAVFMGASAIVCACFLLSVAVKYRVNPMTLLRKNSETFLIALATASSAAAFSSNMSVCEKKFGINNSLCSFGIPLGMIIHKPISSIYNLLLVFFFAGVYHVPCSVSWIVVAVFISAVVAVATPPIPGGGAMAYAILFAQMGIPDEAMAIAITVDMLTDFAVTAFEVFCLPFSLIHSAHRLNMIDMDTLRSKS